jgi:hypothetical protein
MFNNQNNNYVESRGHHKIRPRSGTRKTRHTVGFAFCMPQRRIPCVSGITHDLEAAEELLPSWNGRSKVSLALGVVQLKFADSERFPFGQVKSYVPSVSGRFTAAGVLVWPKTLLATAVDTIAYLAVTGLIAWVVYGKFGLAILRKAWLNLDVVWPAALVVTTVATLLIGRKT